MKRTAVLQAQDAIQATLQVARPIFFGMSVIVCAYLTLFAFQHIEYKLFSQWHTRLAPRSLAPRSWRSR